MARGLEARELLAQLEVQAVEVEAGQRRDLVGAAAQGGQGKGQGAQPLTEMPQHLRHRLPLDDGAGEDEPHPAGKTGLFNGGKKL